MHQHDLAPWQHAHVFAPDRTAAERRVWAVVTLTLVTMVAEIGAGWWWNSMALLADGWHMGTHAVAIGITGVSYWLARRWARDARFSLGPWKVEVLGAYTSAVLLAVVALGIVVESVSRFSNPAPIAYNESLIVAVVGLLVNLVCAWLLHARHAAHSHGAGPVDACGSGARPHQHEQAQHRAQTSADHDLNRHAAYTHVLADAATSVLAIAALVTGKWLGWLEVDPLVGLLGAGMIAWWARNLIVQCATVLLDREMDHPLAAQVRQQLESDGDAKVADLHLWRVGNEAFACAATLVADAPANADTYRARLDGLPGLAHVLIEINQCRASR